MDNGVKHLYINLLGHKKSPKQIFSDWNIFKEVAARTIPRSGVVFYPKYVRMAVKYEAK